MEEKERNQQLSVQSVMITFIFYLNVTDPLTVPFIFIFLPCCEKAYDNNKFCHENLFKIQNSNSS